MTEPMSEPNVKILNEFGFGRLDDEVHPMAEEIRRLRAEVERLKVELGELQLADEQSIRNLEKKLKAHEAAMREAHDVLELHAPNHPNVEKLRALLEAE